MPIVYSIAENETIEMDSFEQSTSAVRSNNTVTNQPRLQFHTNEYPGIRRQIPVSTIEWSSTDSIQFVPISGLEFLANVERVVIQQTIELNELLTQVESENRYIVKIPHAESLYYGTEQSSSFQRSCLGSNRSFFLNLYDHTRQEALLLKRKLACSSCFFGCYLQKLEVWAPFGDRIGTVKQNWVFSGSSFSILDNRYNTIFKVRGPNTCACLTPAEAVFQILSPDGITECGAISHQWDNLMVGYNILVTFPAGNTKIEHKALIIGAAFLLEYMYFEKIKKTGCCKYLC